MFNQQFHKSAAKIIAASLIVLLALVSLPATSAMAATTTVTFTSSGTWVAPAGVTSVTVEAWGGGGGGGRASSSNNKGGGGAGGQYASSVITVSPGNSYAIVVGAGGTGGTSGGNGGTGGDSYFVACSAGNVCAKGGAGGVNNGIGGIGSNTGGVGTTVFAGGSGSNGGSTATGGAGGGGAGSTGVGGDASGNTPGTGTSVGGGNGGAGLTTQGPGNSGVINGGGGGGGYRTSNSQNGGSGARGQVTLTFTYPVPTIGTVTVSPDVNAYTSSTPTITATVTSAVLPTCQYTTDGTTWVAGVVTGSAPSYTCTGSPTGLSGALTLNIKATNGSGDGTGIQITRNVDSTAPTDGLLTVTPGNNQNILNWTAATDSESGLRAANTYVVRFLVGATPPTCSTGTQIYSGTALTTTHSSLSNGTQYSYRVCAYDGVGNASAGATGSGTPATLPTLTSPTATAITSTTATLGATVSSTGGGTLLERGTCWDVNPAPTINCLAASGTGTGTFTHLRTVLGDSKIYYRGYATNGAGTGYSVDGSFYTQPATQASGVTFTNNTTGISMTINWTRGTGGDGVIVLMKAGSDISGLPADGTFTTYTASTTYGVGGTLIGDAYVVFKGNGTSVGVSGLTAGTTYYVRVFEYKGSVDTSGVNQGTNYLTPGAPGNSTTPVTKPTVTTGSVTGRKRTSAILNGTVNPNGSSTTVTFVYGPTSIPGVTPPTPYPYTITADQSPVTGSLAVSVSAQIPGGLTPNTTYYYRAVGTNSAGTVYGSEMSFTTLVAGSTTYYVDKTNLACSDSGGGTISTPFCTIGAGAALADAGDTVWVLHGSYAETVKPSYNGGPGALLLTFKADPGVIVTGNGCDGVTPPICNGGAFRLFSKGYIVMDGFTITGTKDDGISVTRSQYITISHNHISGSGTSAIPKRGMNLSYTTNSTINANTTDHNTNDGILLRNSSNNNTVSNNISFANAMVTASQAAGLSFLDSINNTVSRNIVYGNEDSGMNFYSASTNNIVVNSLSFGNGDHGFDCNDSPYNTFISNTVYGNGTAGIDFEASSGHAVLYNNISVDNGYRLLSTGGSYDNLTNPGNLRFDDTSITGNTLDYDILYSSTADNIIWDSFTFSTLAEFHAANLALETHGVDANPLVTPLFVGPTTVAKRTAATAPYTVIYNPIYDATHPTGDNYHLAAGSIAIDSANSSAPNEQLTDIEGNPRVDILTVVDTGTGVRTYDDRGAYEYQLPLNQTIVFTSSAPTNAVVAGPTYTPTATGGASGNPVVFTIDATATSVCSIGVANAVSFAAVGTCVIDANQAGGNGYNPAPQVQQSFSVGKGSQTITFTSTAPTTAAVAGPTYTPTATGGASGNPITFTIDASSASVCSIGVANAVSFTAIGTCKINADQAGNANYNPAPQVFQSFTVSPGNQTIIFTSTAPTNAVVDGSTYTPTATGGGSANPVTFTIDASAASVCSINLGVVSFTAAGTCTINANQAGNTNYNAAPQVQQSFTVGKGSQTITFTSTAPTNAVAGGPTYIPTATGGASGNPVTFTIDASAASVCSINSGVVSFTIVGTCKINANQAGNGNYNAAPQVQQSFAVGKGEQTIQISTHVPASAAYLTSFTVAANATSGLPVVYSATGVCNNIGATFTMTSSSGICTVHFNQPGDVNYNAAPEVTENVVARGSAQTINVESHAPTSANFTQTFTVSATATSLLPVTYTASGACTNVGATFTMTMAFGTCYVHYNQAGDSNYAAAPEIIEAVAAQGNIVYMPLLIRK